MAVKASTTVTITAYRDTKSVTRYYKLVSATASAPSKPTANPPDGWTDTEPSYTSDSTEILYFCDLTVFSNEEWEYSAVSQSSSYEAAKEAYNKAQNAQTTAEAAQDDAQIAQDMTSVLDGEFSEFKENDYSQVSDNVGILMEYKDTNDADIANIKDELSKELVSQKFARIENGSLILGETNGTTAILQNEQFGFYTPNSNVPASYFGKDGDVWAFNIERGIVTNDLRFNGFQWIARANRNMSLKWLR